ncbi:MAG: hypothetical protein HQL52_14565 [Magnetococcales bacterium]|nr:hypothetical protein [Magnetococcales bacterium]
MVFQVGKQEISKRNKNIFMGIIYSVGFIAVTAAANSWDSNKYNDMLLLSVIGFVVFSNMINAVLYMNYRTKIKDHRVEVGEKGVTFWTKGVDSMLEVERILKVRFRRRKGALDRVVIDLRNGRHIRLEGYDDLLELGEAVVKLLGEVSRDNKSGWVYDWETVEGPNLDTTKDLAERTL